MPLPSHQSVECCQKHHQNDKRSTDLFEISHELEQVQSNSQRIGPRRTQLFEMCCEPQSQLSEQVQNLGSQSQRFIKENGDLMATAGRARLFQALTLHEPQHVWFSPQCGPWSSRSSLNATQSEEHYAYYSAARYDLFVETSSTRNCVVQASKDRRETIVSTGNGQQDP